MADCREPQANANWTNCPLCGGKPADAAEIAQVPCNVRRFRHEVFTLWRCAGCASVHTAGDADLPAYYSQYPLHRQETGVHERIGYRNRFRLLEGAGLRPSDRILDFGCGAGLFVGYLRGKGFPHVYGYDPYVQEYASEHHPDQPFHAVTSYDVIEHYDDPRDFMRTVTALVRPGGILVVGTPDAHGVSIRRTGNPNLHPPYHRHLLSQKALLSLGRESGLDPVHVYDRSCYDSIVPTVNSRFMWRYIERGGGLLETAVEPPKVGMVLRSPELLFLAFFGFFLPLGDNMVVTFHKRISSA